MSGRGNDIMARPVRTGGPIEVIEGRWMLQILLCLNQSERRFADLKSALPRISSNVLTERIRALQNAGLVERHYLPPPAASHVYALASCASDLKPALDELARWKVNYTPGFASAQNKDNSDEAE